MTQEDKAKAYDEALERAKKLQKTCDSQTVVGWCEYIFPVLKESEDEKVRKAILNYFTKCWGNCKDDVCGIHVEDAIAWLEKQGHTDSIIEKAKAEKQRVIITETDGNANIDWDTRSLEDARKLLEHGLQYINTELAKQGGQKEALYDKCRKTQPSHSCQDITALGRCAVEHEQKPADKVEPRFHEDEWIVSNTSNLVYRVDSILLPQTKCYCLSHNGSTVLMNFADEQNYHPWTIQDTKSGDVLASKDAVFIFKHKEKTGLSICRSYCEVIGNSKLGFGFDFSINGVYPATKEQRDTLFAKMRESGYEWDVEKKELKKIEPLTDFEKAFQGMCCDKNKQFAKECCKTLLELAKKQLYSECSEEDEKMLDEIIDFFENGTVKLQHDLSLYASWLKPIKNRVIPQPKQEWNGTEIAPPIDSDVCG